MVDTVYLKQVIEYIYIYIYIYISCSEMSLLFAQDLWHYAHISLNCDRHMVQHICNNSHTKADDIKVVTPPFTAHSFSSSSIQAASAARPGNKRNTILTCVT